MERNIFDSHAHYDDERFNDDRDAVLSALPGQGIVGVVNAASDLGSSRAGFELSARYPFLWFAAGVHPHEAQQAPQDYLDQIATLLREPKAVALGEIGLDYHYDFSPRDVQRRVFEQQLALAKELDKPVIIHDREAHGETLELLKKYRPKGVVHCFSGSAEMAAEVSKLGLYVGFTGVITFKNAKKTVAAAAAVPQGQLLIETDCPYMAPEPHRGKRCDSSMLEYTARGLAEARATTVQEILHTTCANACTLFGINL